MGQVGQILRMPGTDDPIDLDEPIELESFDTEAEYHRALAILAEQQSHYPDGRPTLDLLTSVLRALTRENA